MALFAGFDRIKRTKRKLQRGEITFGLPEALVFAITGVIIAALAAYHYTH